MIHKEKEIWLGPLSDCAMVSTTEFAKFHKRNDFYGM